MGSRKTNKDDCYYYYYSTCSKGDKCTFRHEPAALKNETICIHWLKKNCIRPHCSFRHLEITKNRSKIPCYHETQPGGCVKDHCSYLHKFKVNQPIQNIKSKEEHEVSSDAANREQKIVNKTHSKALISPNATHPSEGRTKEVVHEIRKKSNVTHFLLALGLSKFTGFICTLLQLFETFKYTPADTRKVVADNADIFIIKDEVISLRPQIKICESYCGEEGCNSLFNTSTPCQYLHICRNYMYQNCKEDDSVCLFGHNLNSNHNQSIINKFKLTLLEPQHILDLLRNYVFVTNKRDVKICVDYNERKCTNSSCVDLHLCLKNLAKVCEENENCHLSHNLNDGKVKSIFESCGGSMNNNSEEIYSLLCSLPHVQESINKLKSKVVRNFRENGDSFCDKDRKTCWSHEYEGDVPVSEICYDSVEGFCPNELSCCQRLHSNYHFYWQVKSLSNRNMWVNLPIEHVLTLERAFCDPQAEKILLPPLDPTTLQSSFRELLVLFKGKRKWEANFELMKVQLVGGSDILELRRLQSAFSKHIPEACKFLWYFLDPNNVWIEYGKQSSNAKDSKSSVNSDAIEKHFYLASNEPLNFRTLRFTYTLDLKKMEQTNLQTKTVRKIRRRPMPHLKSGNSDSSVTSLPLHWEIMNCDERVRRVKLDSSSLEYTQLLGYLKQQGCKCNVIEIERVQNPYVWNAFQNKVKEMKSVYTNTTFVSVQQLFHGTNPDTVSKICVENFDWRLHGSNAGQAYGRGVYFSPLFMKAYSYANPDVSGRRYIFVAKVFVGSIITGNSTMVRPPINPQTNLLYDSTVDSLSSPSIIVKYDKQEYFPEYILTLK